MGDVRNLSRIDAKVSVSGPSLAALYPTLPLALPDTPPYRVTGRLVREGDVYSYTGFSGVIGNTDLAGDARYERRQPRPLLTATLKSRSLDLADLGPLVGLPPQTGCGSCAAGREGHADAGQGDPGEAASGQSVSEQRLQSGKAQRDGRRRASERRHAENSRADSARGFLRASETQQRRARARPDELRHGGRRSGVDDHARCAQQPDCGQGIDRFAAGAAWVSCFQRWKPSRTPATGSVGASDSSGRPRQFGFRHACHVGRHASTSVWRAGACPSLASGWSICMAASCCRCCLAATDRLRYGAAPRPLPSTTA